MRNTVKHSLQNWLFTWLHFQPDLLLLFYWNQGSMSCTELTGLIIECSIYFCVNPTASVYSESVWKIFLPRLMVEPRRIGDLLLRLCGELRQYLLSSTDMSDYWTFQFFMFRPYGFGWFRIDVKRLLAYRHFRISFCGRCDVEGLSRIEAGKCGSYDVVRLEAHGHMWRKGGGMMFEDSKRGSANSKRKMTRGDSWVTLVLI